MSKFMIASEENQFALAHYGVKGMKWKHHKALYNGAKNGAEYGAGLTVKPIEVNPINVKPLTNSVTSKPLTSDKVRESVVINGKTYKVDGESYITKDNYGNTIRANSQAELDAINEKKRKDKKDRIKNNIKNLGQRIKNTAKGLKK